MFSAISLRASSEAAEFEQQVWRRGDGLPDNRVTALLQTRDGYLWIGTPAGLARFDGQQFTAFDQTSTPALGSVEVTALAEDAEKTLWIGTTRGLIAWRGRQFERVPMTGNTSDPSVLALCASRHGLWIVTASSLRRFDSNRFTEFFVVRERNDDQCRFVFEDPLGNVWATTLAGLQQWIPLTQQFEMIRHDVRRGGAGFWSQSRLAWVRGSPWTYQWSWLTECREGPARRIVNPTLTTNFTLTTFDADSADNLWLGFEKGGLVRFRDGHFTHFWRGSGLSDDWVLCFCEDHEGNLWFGTERGGLNRWRPRRIRTHTTRHGLADDNVWAVCESRDGTLWLGTDGGVTRAAIDPEIPGGWRWLTNYTQVDGLCQNTVRALHEDRSGALWIGTGNGLNRLDDGGLTRHPLPLNRWGYKIRAIHEDRTGALWVGWEHGLACRRDGVWTNYNFDSELPLCDVRAIAEGRDGALWIGTYGGGLKRWHHGELTTFTETNGLSNNRVWALHEDADGAWWIGTERGLNRLAGGRIVSFTTQHGLPDNLVNQILEDDQGHLWISHDRGLYRVSRAQLDAVARGEVRQVEPVTCDETDGMLSAETNGTKSQPAGIKDRLGRLWFPTAKGVVTLDPRTFDHNRPPPPVVIEEIRANRRVVFGDAMPTNPVTRTLLSEQGRVVLEHGLPANQPPSATESSLELAPGSGRMLEFRYTASSFVAPDKVRFRYRLEGWDDDWIEVGPRRYAYYTNLRPGHYRFHVVARNNHGAWNETGAAVSLHLRPFFHQTWLFYTLCVLASVVVMAALVRWRVREVRRLHTLEAQQAMSRERKRIAQDMHDQLGAQLTQLSLASERLERHLAERGLPLESAAQPSTLARDAIRNLDQVVWVIDPAKDTLDRFVDYLCRNARDYLAATPIRLRLDIPEQLPEAPLPSRVRHNLLMVVKEALHNAARHSGATEVRLSVQLGAPFFVLAIADNGRGFDPARVSGDGNGLANMRDRMNAVGGTLAIESQPGAGTTIRLTAPLGNHQ